MKSNVPSADAPAAKARSPYYRMLHDARYALALNVICALVITFILSPGSHFGQNLVASMCIGTIAFLLIDGMRLTLWGADRRPKFLPFMLIILISVPVAQMLGLTLFSWLTGVDVGGFKNMLPTQMMGTLVFTLLATGGAVLFFSSREKIARLQM
ncbi:MAG: hypothetical protein RSH52_23800, partial [Janthinobacterium sp.]